ncbi:MAG TPA: hypothetical protein EYO33_07615 [Phycisphaerales bacterium]|mgnify:CR=1 FL=1|nr:hypothetical protein [Phycisphaerales bacterium]
MRIVLALALFTLCQCSVLAQTLPPEPTLTQTAYADWVAERAELWQQEVVGLEVAGDPDAHKLSQRIATIQKCLQADASKSELHPLVVRLEWELEESFNELDDEQKKVFYASR